MAKVIKKPIAESDLDEIWDYIADDNPDRATHFLRKIGEKFKVLAESPYIGRSRNEIEPSLRSLPVGHYIIFYRPIDGGIEIIRVLQASRDIDRLF